MFFWLEWTSYVLVGLAVGWYVGKFLRVNRVGVLGNMLAGVVGAMLGGLIFQVFAIILQVIGSLLFAIIGAFAGLVALRWLQLRWRYRQFRK
ncbi:MAG: hypothetical protein SFX18_18220 [Pirellulales bacterium]|nr:hypothetical protein [Pirellulales bacterium]